MESMKKWKNVILGWVGIGYLIIDIGWIAIKATKYNCDIHGAFEAFDEGSERHSGIVSFLVLTLRSAGSHLHTRRWRTYPSFFSASHKLVLVGGRQEQGRFRGITIHAN